MIDFDPTRKQYPGERVPWEDRCCGCDTVLVASPSRFRGNTAQCKLCGNYHCRSCHDDNDGLCADCLSIHEGRPDKCVCSECVRAREVDERDEAANNGQFGVGA